MDEKTEDKAATDKAGDQDEKKAAQRDIPGDFSYTTSSGVFKKILQSLVSSERPSVLNADYLETLGYTGGSARVVPPILKRMGFLNSDGTPTEVYAKFQSDSQRSEAAYLGLKNAFGSIFKINQYAHKLNEDKIKDIVVQITGLPKTDGTARAIVSTFLAIKDFITDLNLTSSEPPEKKENNENHADNRMMLNGQPNLTYAINIVLPETSDISVHNAIFRSLKENLFS